MEEQKPRQIQNAHYYTQGIKFMEKDVEKIAYKITKQRSISILRNKSRSNSPKSINFKQKHLMYKKDLLLQKFQNLQLNQHQKQERRPLKLKLQKANKQNSLMVAKKLHQFSNELEIKFQAQNCLFRRSLQKMETIFSRSLRANEAKKSESVEKIKIQYQPSPMQQSENQKKLKTEIEKLQQQKQRQQEEIRKLKTINNFLTSENYKLSMENGMFKTKILEYEQNDYDNALKSITDLDGQEDQNNFKEENEIERKNVTQKQFSHVSIQNKKQESESSKKNVLIKHIQTEHFSLEDKNIDEQNPSQTQNESNPFSNLAKELKKLNQKIKDLQEHLNDQKLINDTLSNELAMVKLKNHYQATSTQPCEVRQNLESAISIKMQLRENKISQNSIAKQNSEPKIDEIKESVRKIHNQLVNLSCKGTKSKILSNQIIYFSEAIPNQSQQINKKRTSQTYQNSNQLRSSNQKDQNAQNLESQSKETKDEDERRKTLCMKKLQMPTEQIQKRRKSISEKLSISLDKKGLNANNSLSFYSNHKVNQLEVIKETISLKFQAFKYTYELFQNQMIQWPNGSAKLKELKSILEQYPFFLDGASSEVVLNYCNVTEGKETRIDKFCNKLKEFITEHQEMTEEEEIILQKKIYKRWKYTSQQIMDQMRKNQTCQGQISKTKFVSVFEEFKFEEKQIHHLLCQSVAISSDINHIKYREYLENFLSRK